MGRIKKDHSGWRTQGIWAKYQQPKIVEAPQKLKSKRDKRKWCHGKIGKEHVLERYIYSWWDNWYPPVIKAKCKECNRDFYGKSWSRRTDIPLRIDVDYQCYCDDSTDDHTIRVTRVKF